MISDSDLKARFPQSFGYVTSLRKTSLRLVASKADDASIPIGASKLGGAPDLVSIRDWPASGDRSMSFVAQVRLDPIGDWDEDALLPRSGLLLFFASAEGAAKGGKVIHLDAQGEGDAASKLRRAAPEADARAYEAASVTLVRASSFPKAPSPFVDLDAIHPKERAAYGALLAELEAERNAPDHRLLGYPSDASSLTSADGDTRMLLQVDDDPRLGFAWSAGKLVFLVQDASLRRGEVGSARVV